MCKLNIQCTLSDEECSCNCTSKAIKCKETLIPEQKSLLCSILHMIQSQPSIMKVLGPEVSNKIFNKILDQDEPIEDLTTSSSSDSCKVRIVNDLPEKIIVGKSFPIMAEIFGTKTQVEEEKQTVFRVELQEAGTGKVLECLAEMQAKGTAFFRKLMVSDLYQKCDIVVRVKGIDGVEEFRKRVVIKERRGKELMVKKSKIIEILT